MLFYLMFYLFRCIECQGPNYLCSEDYPGKTLRRPSGTKRRPFRTKRRSIRTKRRPI